MRALESVTNRLAAAPRAAHRAREVRRPRPGLRQSPAGSAEAARGSLPHRRLPGHGEGDGPHPGAASTRREKHLGHRDHHAHLRAMEPLWLQRRLRGDVRVTGAAGSRSNLDGPWFVPSRTTAASRMVGRGMELRECEGGGDECIAEHWRRLYYVFQGSGSADGPGSAEQATWIPESSARGTPAAMRFTEFLVRYGGPLQHQSLGMAEVQLRLRRRRPDGPRHRDDPLHGRRGGGGDRRGARRPLRAV